MLKHHSDRGFGETRSRFKDGQTFLNMTLNDGVFRFGQHAGLGNQAGIDGGLPDILEQRAERQFFQLRLRYFLLSAQRNNQRRRRHGMLGRVSLHPFEASQRRQSIWITQDRFDHFADHRLEPRRINSSASPRRQHQLGHCAARLTDQATGAAAFLAQ